ncbi:unnamed protein product [Periconia digitata]|uniref:Uncharacterized protein n=1 Tax=Periconia digitata TaxID=1303443 RepID=A0A9W4XPD3_9PLEO|nr:unnamed protein product [Periconia digitata]
MSNVHQPFLPSQYDEEKTIRATTSTWNNYANEEPKEALKRGLKSFPIVEVIVHALAIGTVGVLIWLNVVKMPWVDFVIDDDTVETGYWQLVAKAHELLITTSLSYIAFYYMRAMLMGERGVPFGLLSSTYQFSKPTMLYRHGAWISAVSHRAIFGLTLLVFGVISNLANPFSAILMIPTPGWVTTGERISADASTIHIPGSKNLLWPSAYNETFNSDGQLPCNMMDDYDDVRYQCPAFGHKEILNWFTYYMGTGSYTDASFAPLMGGARRDAVVSCTQENCNDSSEAYSTVMTELETVSIGSYSGWARNQNLGGIRDVPTSKFTVSQRTPSYQPVVAVNCKAGSWNAGREGIDITFPDIQSKWSPSEGPGRPPFTTYLNQSYSGANDFQWFKDTQDNSSSILALAILPLDLENPEEIDKQTNLYVACAIDARWFANLAWYSPKNSATVQSNVTRNLPKILRSKDVLSHTALGISASPIDISLDGAVYLNPTKSFYDNDTYDTAMSYNYSLLGDFLDGLQTHKDISSTWLRPAEKFVSSLLSLVVADGLARSASTWARNPPFLDIHDSNPVILGASDAISKEASEGLLAENAKSDQYLVEIEVERYVYGWIPQGISFWFAVGIFLLYALIAAGHLLYILFIFIFWNSKYCGGTCWDYMGDLVALAMNSSPTPRLYGTGAGIKKWDIWKNSAKVRSFNGERLELCFLDDGEEAGELIQPGKKYY